MTITVIIHFGHSDPELSFRKSTKMDGAGRSEMPMHMPRYRVFLIDLRYGAGG